MAFGLARLLADLLDRQTDASHDVRIADRGTRYQLTCSPALARDAARQLPYLYCPVKPIRTATNAGTLPSGIPYLDYETDRDQVRARRAARDQGADDALPVPAYWDIERAIHPLSLPGYNSLAITWWALGEEQSDALALLLDLYATTPNDHAQAIAAWKRLDDAHEWGIRAEATQQQLFNPDRGKGQNKAKANGLAIGNAKGFWLTEWLKAIGLYEAGLTQLARGTTDRKTFVIAPRDLSYAAHRSVMRDFRDTMASETAIKFDILAAIRYTRALLSHISRDDSLILRLLDRQRPTQLVAGFETAFYKDLGQATATMNMSFIALPGWVTITTRDDIALYAHPDQGLLTQLEWLTQQFDESHGDTHALLRHLRDFVSGGDLAALFRFTDAFAGYYIRARHQGRFAYPLTTRLIDRLIMGADNRLSAIPQHPGFQHVANAIRQSAVIAPYQTQAFRQRGGRYPYNARYGLARDLLRRARRRDEFAADLGDFLSDYAAETARVAARMRKRQSAFPFPGQRRTVRASDLDDVLLLMDEYGSETVAHLLIAYGYARVPRERGDQDHDAPSEEPDS